MAEHNENLNPIDIKDCQLVLVENSQTPYIVMLNFSTPNLKNTSKGIVNTTITRNLS